MASITVDPRKEVPPTRDHAEFPDTLPPETTKKVHPTTPGNEDASIYFVGNATTILEWAGARIMTDPNFLHAGDHVHLGPGVSATRQKNPAFDLHELPRIDAVLLSHYHEDHFDRKVEDSLRRSLPIITTPHAKECLQDKKSEEEKFTNVTALNFFETMFINISGDGDDAVGKPSVKVTGMPGKHVPPGPLSVANDILKAVPPTNGWMVELGYSFADKDSPLKCGYRIYISGDTLLVDELKEIPERYKGQNIDLMLIHLGGTTIPGPSAPLIMVTMDAEQGVKLMQLVKPDITIPIHFDDYDVFLSPLDDFKKAVEESGLSNKVVYLDRKDRYNFQVKK